jgi:ferric-dicitrate binding protein FerR (iron transport regulator)
MNIHNYRDFNVIDFVEDEVFRSWVLLNDKSKDFFWRTYLVQYPAQKEIVEDAKQLLISLNHSFEKEVIHITIPKDNFKQKLADTMEANMKSIVNKPTKRKEISRKPLVGFLVAIALLISICACYFIFNSSVEFEKIEYVTGNGEWKKLKLPDGSYAELNANSKLSILNDWKEGENRQVWLKGEAFFNVEKKPSTGAKFFVITKDLKVEVLGTMFNVNTRNERTEVFLEEGKIILDLNDTKEEIVPGEFISYSQVQKKIINRYKKTDEIHSDWKKGVIKIDDKTIAEIIKELEIIYGIDIISNDPKLLDKEGSIAVPVDDLSMTMAILERTLGIKAKMVGNQYYIE